MRRGVVLSVVLHVVVFGLVVLGLPRWREPPKPPAAISVAMVRLADRTAAPPAPVKRQPEAPKPEPPKVEAPKSETKPEPPKAEAPVPTPPPTPRPVAEPPKQVALAPPPASTPEPTPKAVAPAPRPEPKPEPKSEPQAKKEPERPKLASEKKAAEKPKEPEKPKTDEFAAMASSLLKDLRKTEPAPKEPPKKDPDRPRKPDFEDVLKAVGELKPPSPSRPKESAAAAPRQQARLTDSQLTMSEEDALRRQIERCWNVPAGAKEGGDLIVEVKVRLNQDGSVRDARAIESPRMSDPFYRAAADSAVRAVHICSPLKVPPEKFSTWKEMTLTFNPKDLLG